MARSQNKNAGETRQRDFDRYRQAAEDALQQLDSAIGYLHGIRKTEISKRAGQEPLVHPEAADERAGRADAGPTDRRDLINTRSERRPWQ
jgi:hypothetical protein